MRFMGTLKVLLAEPLQRKTASMRLRFTVVCFTVMACRGMEASARTNGLVVCLTAKSTPVAATSPAPLEQAGAVWSPRNLAGGRIPLAVAAVRVTPGWIWAHQKAHPYRQPAPAWSAR